MSVPMQAGAASAPPLWAALGDMSLVRARLWPLLDDRSALRALRCNRASMECYQLYPHRHEWSQRDIEERLQLREGGQPASGAARTRRWPRIERVSALTSASLLPLLPYLRCLALQYQSWDVIGAAVSRLPLLTRLSVTWPYSWENPEHVHTLSPPLPALSGTRILDLSVDGYNAPLPVGALPSSLRHLELGDHFNQPIDPGALPHGLTHLTLAKESRLTQPPFGRSERMLLPTDVPSCDSDAQFDQALADDVLPDTLVCLILGSLYRQPLPARLPNALRSVIFYTNGSSSSGHSCFDQPVRLASSSLTQLFLPHAWKQPLERCSLPPTLKALHMGHGAAPSRFNHPLEADSLPPSLTLLDLERSYFNQPLTPGALPACLTSLSLGDSFCQPLDANALPHSLHQLRLGRACPLPIEPGVLPASLTHLTLKSKCSLPWAPSAFPAGLCHLHLTRSDYNLPFEAGVLPVGLRTLHLSCNYNQPFAVGVLPVALDSLLVPVDQGRFNHPFEAGALPPRVSSCLRTSPGRCP